MQKQHENRLKRIIDDTHDKLYSVLFGMCADPHLCEDIIQETYIRLWQHLPAVKDDHAILALLRQYARNLFLDEMRKRVRQKEMLMKISSRERLVHPSADKKVLDEERQLEIQRAISKLPQQQQLIFRMHKEHDMSYREIAATLEIATGTIEKQMTRALRSIRHHLKGKDDLVHLS
ncbi:RNA polymerase sigma factor [Chitinophaga defluvii]|uniref:RNA polymerase sigma factor n=1 Tax=Chitinophaga defluvii TaxID=3163343 RepID=A0ABV2TER9_9BACT